MMAAKEVVGSELTQLRGSNAEKLEVHEKVSEAKVKEVAQLEERKISLSAKCDEVSEEPAKSRKDYSGIETKLETTMAEPNVLRAECGGHLQRIAELVGMGVRSTSLRDISKERLLFGIATSERAKGSP